MSPSGLLPDILEVLAGFKADRPPWGNADFLAGARVTPDAALPGLDLKDPEAAKLDAVSALHRQAHGVEHRVDGNLSLDLGDVGDLGNFVNDVDLDHGLGRLCR